MRDVSPILRSIGLTDSEIHTYLATLEGGPQTVIDITKRTNLSRQAVYIAIEALTQRGLMISILHGKKRVFAAESPETLLAYARRKEAELKMDLNKLEEALPDLQLASSGSEKPAVKIYEGREGILALLTELQASSTKTVFEITDAETMRRILTPEELRPLQEKVAKLGVKVHGIYSGYRPLEDTSPVQNKEIHNLPPRFSRFKTNISIFGDKTALVSFEGAMHSVIIHNKALSNTFRILFELAIKGCRAEERGE